MVAMLNGIVHFGTIRLDIGTHQNMIKSEVHTTHIVTDARTITTTCVGIVQIFRQAMMHIRDEVL